MNKYKVLYLPRSSLEANLNDLSLQGWEFVAWEQEKWSAFTPGGQDQQRRALLRQLWTEGDAQP